MNIGIIAKVLGFLTLGLCGLGLLPLLVAITAGDSGGPWPWLIMIGVSLAVAWGLLFAGRKAQGSDLGIREGIAITSAVWVIASLLSCIGIWLATPAIDFFDAWFESMSGFTTTGSTVFGAAINISELNDGVLIWRATGQWLGGLGIVVISLSLLPLMPAPVVLVYTAPKCPVSATNAWPRASPTRRACCCYFIRG